MFKQHFKKLDKELLMKILTVIIICFIALLTFDVTTNKTDGRRQIIDEDGGEETALCTILSDIRGAGEVDVMVKYDDDNKVIGVIVTSSGADSIIVKNNLTSAVAALYDISVSNVMVFEKEDGGNFQ